jgi:hypothetical protein
MQITFKTDNSSLDDSSNLDVTVSIRKSHVGARTRSKKLLSKTLHLKNKSGAKRQDKNRTRTKIQKPSLIHAKKVVFNGDVTMGGNLDKRSIHEHKTIQIILGDLRKVEAFAKELPLSKLDRRAIISNVRNAQKEIQLNPNPDKKVVADCVSTVVKYIRLGIKGILDAGQVASVINNLSNLLTAVVAWCDVHGTDIKTLLN